MYIPLYKRDIIFIWDGTNKDGFKPTLIFVKSAEFCELYKDKVVVRSIESNARVHKIAKSSTEMHAPMISFYEKTIDIKDGTHTTKFLMNSGMPVFVIGVPPEQISHLQSLNLLAEL